MTTPIMFLGDTRNANILGPCTYSYYKKEGDRIFGNAEPYVSAKNFVESLISLGHNVVYVTSQPQALQVVTFDWIKFHLPESDGIMFTDKKWL